MENALKTATEVRFANTLIAKGGRDEEVSKRILGS